MPARPHFQRLVERVRNLPALPTAIVYPCDRDSLQVALSGQFAGYLAPVLVGPEARIADAAAHAGLDLSRIELVDTPDDPAEAARRAVGLARDGTVRALIKGSLYPDDLMRAVAAPDAGLRGERRLTHAFFIDVPGFARPFLLSDAVLNIAPNLAAKREIVQNAIDLAHALGTPNPQVAVLAAVEGVTPRCRQPATPRPWRKCRRKALITGGTVAGPLTADSALSADAARANGVDDPVAGHADVLDRARPRCRLADAAHADGDVRCARCRHRAGSEGSGRSRRPHTTRWKCGWPRACSPRWSPHRRRNAHPPRRPRPPAFPSPPKLDRAPSLRGPRRRCMMAAVQPSSDTCPAASHRCLRWR